MMEQQDEESVYLCWLSNDFLVAAGTAGWSDGGFVCDASEVLLLILLLFPLD